MFVKTKGIDNGYGFTKDSDFNIFKSAYSESEPFALSNEYKLIVDGKTFWIGEGDNTIEVDKADSLLNKLCTLNCLALTEGNEFNIVVGLPINQYKKDRDKFKEIVMGYDKSEIQLNDNTPKTIKINNVFVHSQGIASLHVADIRHDVILVDVGSMTVDVAYLRYNQGKFIVVQSNTYYCGCSKLYSKLIDAINIEFKLTLKSEEGQKYLKEDLRIHSVPQNISNIRVQVFKEHFKELLLDLKRDYPTSTVPIALTGGGAEILLNTCKANFSDTTSIKNNQFSNALGYYEKGIKLFGESGVLKWQMPKQILSK